MLGKKYHVIVQISELSVCYQMKGSLGETRLKKLADAGHADDVDGPGDQPGEKGTRQPRKLVNYRDALDIKEEIKGYSKLKDGPLEICKIVVYKIHETVT